MGSGALALRSWATMVIKLGVPRVCGVVYGDLLEVEVPLDADGLSWPDEEWLSLFRGYGEFPGELEEPRLEHGRLRFEARDEDLGRAWIAIRDRVSVVNRAYATRVPARDRSGERSEAGRRDDVDERIRAAQRMLDSLEGLGGDPS